MSIKKLLVNGQPQLVATDLESTENLQLEAIYDLSPGMRGTTALVEVPLKEDQLLGFEFDDGGTWYGDAESLPLLFPETEQLQRGQSDGFLLPASLQDSGSASRGIIGQVGIKILKIFSKKAVQHSVAELAKKLEIKQLNNQSGLFRLTAAFQLV